MLLRRVSAPDPGSLSITVDGRALAVRLQRRPAAKRVTLRLSVATGAFTLSAPPRVPLAVLRRFLDDHSGWAAARLRRLPERVAWVPGGKVPLRGTEHRIVHDPRLRLTTRVGPPGADGVPTIVVGGAEDAVSGRIARFLRAEAATDLRRAVDRHAAALGRRVARVAVRDTRSRWGSCSSGGTLSFSWRLILAPPLVLDYLAAHECAHLVEMNHSGRFWTLARRLCPATDEAEAWLNRHGAALHRFG